ncbi:NgoBV family restriction endonuclease [Streptobacillus moniliformis]|uniref:NgoBV family restriction endonuclease n=2 Tax=Streptobacillus moniliformis TaxID=34105 RepID=UPI0007E467AF|nr:NgoBV family restriction endonuclease [Streptobacillus moniliformis]
MILTANKIFFKLKSIDWTKAKGIISFNLADINVTINTNDTVGLILQAWLKEYLNKNNILFREPSNTQEFPDFLLSHSNIENLLEIKSFNFSKSPTFDIANFDSYCDSIKENPYRLDADYIIFGYDMEKTGIITIKDIWLKKIWEIAGTSKKYPLKTQVKRNIIYNIRPNTAFKNYNASPFKSREQFIHAIYETLLVYKGSKFVYNWLNIFSINYKAYYNAEFKI